MSWISVKDRLPKEDEWVFVKSTTDLVTIGMYISEREDWDTNWSWYTNKISIDDDSDEGQEVIYWMKIPE